MKVISLFFVLIFFLSGCSKNENEPITLCYSIFNDKPNPVIGNQIDLQYPAEKIQLLILGGDGNFTINNSDDTKLKINIDDKLMDIIALSIGTATITINDKSNNSYILNVKISYAE